MADAHTPGPWIANGLFVHAPGQYGSGGHGYCIASCNVEPAAESEAVDAANARLIAAAPTMAAYIALQAEMGDAEAVKIMEAIRGSR